MKYKTLAKTFKRIDLTLKRFKFKRDNQTILALGDSWFNLTVLDYPFKDIDTLDFLKRDFNVIDLAIPGNKLENEATWRMFKMIPKDFNKGQKRVILLSFGGNDIVHKFSKYVKNYSPEFSAEYHIGQSFISVISEFKFSLEHYLKDVLNYFCGDNKIPCEILIHGYDYFQPQVKLFGKDSKIEKVFDDKNYPEDSGMRKEIISMIVSYFGRQVHSVVKDINLQLQNSGYQKIAKASFVDIKGLLNQDDWMEMIHPTPEGYKKIADEFKKQITF